MKIPVCIAVQIPVRVVGPERRRRCLDLPTHWPMPQVGPQVGPQVEPQVEPQVGPHVEPPSPAGPQVGPQVEPQVEPQMGPHVEPTSPVGPPVGPQVKPLQPLPCEHLHREKQTLQPCNDVLTKITLQSN